MRIRYCGCHSMEKPNNVSIFFCFRDISLLYETIFRFKPLLITNCQLNYQDNILFPHYWLSLSGTAKTKNCVTYPEVYPGNTNTNVKHYRWNLERLFAGLAIKRVRAGSGVAVGNFPLRKCYSRHCFTKLALTASASSFMKRATLDIKTPLRLHFENRLHARRSMLRPKQKNSNA